MNGRRNENASIRAPYSHENYKGLLLPNYANDILERELLALAQI